MRFFPLLTACVVAAALYMMIFERETLYRIAGREPVAEQTEAEPVRIAETETLAPGTIRVVAMTSTAEQIDNAVLLRGRTEAARTVQVRSETAGLVISDPLPKGGYVEAADVMCTLDPGTRDVSLAEAEARLAEASARVPEAAARIPEAEARIPESAARLPEAEARVSEAQARLDEANTNLKTTIKLAAEGFASETKVTSMEAAVQTALAGVQSARAGLEAARAGQKTAMAGVETALAGVQAAKAGIQGAEAGIAAARKEIERLTIRAPFGGLLESDTAETGSLMQPGALCATIIQLDPIMLVGFVPETDIDRIEVGALAGARLAGGQEVQGRVTFLSRSADESTRTFRLEVEVANSDLSIRDGQTAEIIIAADGERAHLLPQSALTLDDDGTLGIRAVVDGQAQFMAVRVLRDTVQGIWVADLPDTVDVILVGQEFVIDGVPVAATFKEVI